MGVAERWRGPMSEGTKVPGCTDRRHEHLAVSRIPFPVSLSHPEPTPLTSSPLLYLCQRMACSEPLPSGLNITLIPIPSLLYAVITKTRFGLHTLCIKHSVWAPNFQQQFKGPDQPAAFPVFFLLNTVSEG